MALFEKGRTKTGGRGKGTRNKLGSVSSYHNFRRKIVYPKLSIA
jgi:hypothetical protein